MVLTKTPLWSSRLKKIDKNKHICALRESVGLDNIWGFITGNLVLKTLPSLIIFFFSFFKYLVHSSFILHPSALWVFLNFYCVRDCKTLVKNKLIHNFKYIFILRFNSGFIPPTQVLIKWLFLYAVLYSGHTWIPLGQIYVCTQTYGSEQKHFLFEYSAHLYVDDKYCTIKLSEKSSFSLDPCSGSTAHMQQE